MTCDSFKSNGLGNEELDDVDVAAVADKVNEFTGGDTFDNSKFSKLLEDFDCNFMLDEEDEDFNVEGFAGTKN